jgi:hypothetical protein
LSRNGLKRASAGDCDPPRSPQDEHGRQHQQ